MARRLLCVGVISLENKSRCFFPGEFRSHLSTTSPPPKTGPRFGQKKNLLLVSKPGEVPSPKPVAVSSSRAKLPVKKSTDRDEPLFDGSQAGSVALSASHGAVSSSELLSRMQRRQLLSTVSNGGGIEDVSSEHNRLDPQDQELIEDIRSFIAFMGDTNGQASTQELMTNFGPRLPKSDSAKFKAMLLQICDFSKIHGTGMWQLKQEFR